ncbi:hypothetical protein RvY_04710 [Ramazzottius varieornatus]|uniref:Cation/H+ exchanger transmembrane domain-containing protein n=1 Tax=Ramazzottius varieornatus TaxID=947166 RepID=A0A1D1UT78_RAMVA|nr:hypothetical protein RvY_04710 [Ramazzottius varieornatus]
MNQRRASEGNKYLCIRCADPTCKNEQCQKPGRLTTSTFEGVGFMGKVKKAVQEVLRPALKSSHTQPSPDAPLAQRLKYDLLLPPTGIVSRLVTLALLAFMIWAALWSVLGSQMLLHGNVLGLYMIVLVGLAAGWLVERMRLAPLLGMLIVGALFRNVYPIDFARYVDSKWSSVLRNLALTVILTRAGLGLDQDAIRKRLGAVMSLALLPTFGITIFIAILAHYMINFPWLFSAALGFLISAVSPAVIVPIMLVFQEQKLGQGKGIPSLIIAAATICDVIAICGNSICLGVALSNGSLAFNIAAIFLTFIVGFAFGIFVGWILVYFPSGDDDTASIFRFVLLLCSGALCIFGSKIANLSGAGAIGALIVPVVASRGWRHKGYGDSIQKIAAALKSCWYILQPLLFGLIGAAVDIATLKPDKVGLFIGLLFAAHAVQLLVTYLATFRFGFTWKENLFLAISFLPKATIQAAIGATALDIATKNRMSYEYIQLGADTLNCAVLAILFFAPIGGVLLMATGGYLLDKPSLLPTMAVTPATTTSRDSKPANNLRGPVRKDEDTGTVNGSFVADQYDVRRRGSSNQVNESRQGRRSR